MTNKAYGAHSCTSLAVKAVVKEVRQRLSRSFDFLEGIPDFFYDFDLGLTDRFKQYYAKIPISKRKEPWIALSYSYDSADKSSVQPRNGFSFPRPVTSTLKRYIDFKYTELPLLFSVLTNDSKTYNALNNFIAIDFDWSFTTHFEDLLWPLWVENKEIPLGWYIRPSKPNGFIYMCSQQGLSGEDEPEWPTEINETIEDNEVVWSCIQPDLLTVKAGTFVKNSSSIKNPIEDGIMYQLDFGFTLHYADYIDSGKLVGTITEATMKLLSMYNKAFDYDILNAPE